VRIVGRVFGIPTRDASRRSKIFREAYRLLLDEERPREFNYAMLDLGALLCRARRPLCKVCPVRELCEYGKSR
jgi:A/G-specific adenine glycosylase